MRCSRCNTTFDALDNLLEAPPVVEESAPIEKPEPPPPPPQAEPDTDTLPPANDTPTEPSELPTEETKVAPVTTDDEMAAEEAVEAEPEDTLSAFISELEESTGATTPSPTEDDESTEDELILEEEPLPLVEPEEPAEEELGEQIEFEGNDELILQESSPAQDYDILSAALDSIGEIAETDEGPIPSHETEITEKFPQDDLSIERDEGASEPGPGDDFDVNEKIGSEVSDELVLEEGPLPLVEPEEPAEEETVETAEPETGEELLLDEGPLPLVEPEEFAEKEAVETAEPETDEELLLDEGPLRLVEPEEFAEKEAVETAEPETSDELVLEGEPLPLVELEEPVEEEVLEAGEPESTDELTLEEEPLSLVEPEELLAEEETVETAEPETDEELVLEEEPLPLVEQPEELLADEETIETTEPETGEELLLDEEPLPLVEPEEPAEEETVETAEPEAGEELLLDEEASPLVEPEEPVEEEASEPEVSDEALDAFFDESEPEESLEEVAAAVEAISEEDLDAFFEETEAEESATEVATAVEAVSEEDLDDFFEEEEPPQESAAEATAEQGDLLEGLDEEAALDEVQLPEEEVELSPQPASSPLDPYSEEQIESLLSPAGELADEEQVTPQPDEEPLQEEPVAALEAEEENDATEAVAAPAAYAIPAELVQSKQGSTGGALLWGVGIAIMCAGLILQYLYFHRLQLVDNPQLRPLLTTMCGITGCNLPPRRDLGQIELAEHMMQFHPNYEKSLLITATLANRADYPQPYPLVEIVMTDIEQKVVARRHFTAEQYLSNKGGDSFPANSEVPLLLEVLDPGNQAVGFEFRFY